MRAFTGATFDSRLVRPGMLYVALKGEHADGRDFIPQALEKGAAGVIEGREALAEAAREYRRTLKAKVIGVTGSAGKTTVKELTAKFLSTVGPTYATQGNYNNDIGLPITILNCPRDAGFLVVEMGTNHPGEIRRLVEIAEPDAGVISSIGTAHIEFFKTQDGIAAEKGELFRAVKDFAVVSRENARYEALCAMSAASVTTTSKDDAESAALREALRDVLPGEHNVSNARLAFAVAHAYGAKLEDCLRALEGFRLPGHRWEVTERDGVTFVNDAYNANPDSMLAALGAFVGIYGASRGTPPRRLVAVLGDMFELGSASDEMHRKVFDRAAELGIDVVIGVGEASSRCRCTRAYPTSEALCAEFRALLAPGDAVLLKASRGMRLEKLLAN